jgi:hypothetical protein
MNCSAWRGSSWLCPETTTSLSPQIDIRGRSASFRGTGPLPGRATRRSAVTPGSTRLDSVATRRSRHTLSVRLHAHHRGVLRITPRGGEYLCARPTSGQPLDAPRSSPPNPVKLSPGAPPVDGPVHLGGGDPTQPRPVRSASRSTARNTKNRGTCVSRVSTRGRNGAAAARSPGLGAVAALVASKPSGI